MKRGVVRVFALSASALAVCSAGFAESPNGAADPVRALRDADRAHAATTDAEGFLGFYSDDAFWLYTGQPVMDGKSEIGAWFAPAFARTEFVVGWEPTRVYVGPSGDMGYTSGDWHASWKDGDGQPQELTGTYLSVWRREADGTWKIVAGGDLAGKPLFSLPPDGP